jgi:hypothetical protein
MIFGDISQIFIGSWISAQKRDTRAILLKTASVRVSCIQNTQIREETIAKVFGKGDTFWTYHDHKYVSQVIRKYLLGCMYRDGICPSRVGEIYFGLTRLSISTPLASMWLKS